MTLLASDIMRFSPDILLQPHRRAVTLLAKNFSSYMYEGETRALLLKRNFANKTIGLRRRLKYVSHNLNPRFPSLFSSNIIFIRALFTYRIPFDFCHSNV